MQPLIYDFGQLTNVTEKDYTVQIVKDRVSIFCNSTKLSVKFSQLSGCWLLTVFIITDTEECQT